MVISTFLYQVNINITTNYRLIPGIKRRINKKPQRGNKLKRVHEL